MGFEAPTRSLAPKRSRRVKLAFRGWWSPQRASTPRRSGGLTMHGAFESFKEGGWGMWPILFWSILTIGIIVERAIYLFGASINKDVFLATMQKCILAGDIAKAVKMCSAANAPL